MTDDGGWVDDDDDDGDVVEVGSIWTTYRNTKDRKIQDSNIDDSGVCVCVCRQQKTEAFQKKSVISRRSVMRGWAT